MQESIIKNIKSATGTEVDRNTIIPVCAKWVLTDSHLIRWLMSHSQGEKKPPEIIKAAVKALERYKIPLPSGQDQTQEQAINECDPKLLLKQLEEASGMFYIKKRLVF